MSNTTSYTIHAIKPIYRRSVESWGVWCWSRGDYRLTTQPKGVKAKLMGLKAISQLCLFLIEVAFGMIVTAEAADEKEYSTPIFTADMVWIPGGSFQMGSDIPMF